MNRYILLLFMGLTCSLHAQVIVIKNVQYFKQEKTEWCAAAVSQSVLLYRGITKTQCEIMEYVQKNSNSHGGPNGYGCCVPDPPTPGWDHPCNKPVTLSSEYEPPASVYGILKYFGNFHHHLREQPDPVIDEIVFDLNHKNPIIAQWDHKNPYYGDPEAHVVVIYGINRDYIKDSIYYMDPAPTKKGGGLRRLPYNEFKDNSKSKWKYSLTYAGCFSEWKGDYPCPCHCYNNRWDADLGEQGIDCGYQCPPCPYIPPQPPPESCTDCIQNWYESGIDCGGPYCRPCSDPPEEIVLPHPVYDLSSEIRALKKITNNYSYKVESGKKKTFITEEEGSIVLRPGFTAESGCTFTTQRKDLSEYFRECPEKFCAIKHSLETHCTRGNYPYNRQLTIQRLYYAVEIKYKIYNENGVVLDRVQKVLNNGYIYLWNCQDGANSTVSYTIDYTVTYCDSTKKNYTHQFLVGNCFLNFSPNNPDDPEIPSPSLSPPLNSITLPNEPPAPTLSIIPNPNGGTFQLETNFPLTAIESLKITNMLGVPVYESQNITSPTIQLTGLASGQYFVVVLLKDGTLLTQKLMLQR